MPCLSVLGIEIIILKGEWVRQVLEFDQICFLVLALRNECQSYKIWTRNPNG